MYSFHRLFGCYEALDGGELAEALEDFTGGVSESYDIVEAKFSNDEAKKKEFFHSMKTAMENNSLLCTSILVSTFLSFFGIFNWAVWVKFFSRSNIFSRSV